MGDLKDAIRTERWALIDVLEHLDEEQWATRSLCEGWTVKDVAAHVAWAPVQRPLHVVGTLIAGGFRVNKVNAENARRWSRRGTSAILDQLRTNAETGASPPGVPRGATVTDAVVHALDIRRPLSILRALPCEAFEPTAAFLLGLRWPLSASVGGAARRRVAGLRLVADDLDWAYGAGPEVRAHMEALILVLSGRPVEPGELTGAGAAQLYARL